ncbi:glycoside hydrolase family 37 protein [Conidiobolus coronatus NRRL 28638]|uniref:Trehalase n=1 Tax=Conidiobolus coronatus (strain ATCC 28846 / CBS 209.66 / NRRL 28638) TaxID=796925 RepID=A0A137P2I1_CONC2|nr:glycoside hydrolase family 37 protein [Conidiobolus coronatus NRRL 28638]|eukprot:KXN69246.1 glycoside hydrolase family 37 protein [Conidiobolus coronatus NRRL 28638]
MNLISLLSLLLLGVDSQSTKCDSPIYCDGKILKAIQLAGLFKDSKTFVDMSTKVPQHQVVSDFDALGDNPTKEQLQKFVDDHFNSPAFELTQYNITEYNPNPKFLDAVSDPGVKGFAKKINGFWSSLVLEDSSKSKLCDGCVTSLLPIPDPFVVPGGRFREFYYWDTYFSLEGLMLGELYNTTKGMLNNFLHFVDTYGFVPNGARQYYLNRSQPPLLSQMVVSYVNKTGDLEFAKKALPTLDKEYKYWIEKHSVKVPCSLDDKNRCQLVRYDVVNQSPRPESYIEDFKTVEYAPGLNQTQKDDLYADLATGAETGWDYTTRWILPELKNFTSNNTITLRSLHTRQVIPADLNALIYQIERNLIQLHKTALSNSPNDCDEERTKNQVHKDLIQQYDQRSKDRVKIMHELMWDTSDYSFHDYLIDSNQKYPYFSASNYWPFWTGAITDELKSDYDSLSKVYNKVAEIGEKYPGGIPSTLLPSHLQWDLPNSWPPLEYVLIYGMLQVRDHLQDEAQKKKLYDLALKQSQTYFNSAFCGWYSTGGSIEGILERNSNVTGTDSGHMFEKFDVTTVGLSGGGGEYDVQTGFGWTNGVLVSLVNTFNKDLKFPDVNICAPPAHKDATASAQP